MGQEHKPFYSFKRQCLENRRRYDKSYDLLTQSNPTQSIVLLATETLTLATFFISLKW